MKINFGAGRTVLPGFFNIDAVAHPAAPYPPEMMFELAFKDGALVERIPLADGCAEELCAFHVIEHFYRYDVDAVVAEWKRLLLAGGKLTLELPNIEASARNLLAGMSDQMCMWGLYGDPSHGSPFMCHRWGYSPKTITSLLAFHGFDKIAILPPRTHKKRLNRDMRVEAIKA